MKAYPIKFNPILKNKVWGGEKLSKVLNKKTMAKNVGESWEISGVEGNISEVSNGIYEGRTLNDLISEYKGDFLGKKVVHTYGEQFPLLIKFLDAKTNLSVQVHPDDDMAKTQHNSFGKTEMWYIMESDDDAEIVLGLKNSNTDTAVLNHINANNVNEIFNKEKVKKGDSYFIPAGKIHAIGAGVLAAEIQQTSDITYRVYDWDRADDNGSKRELHTELAQRATKVFQSNGKSDYCLNASTTSNLVDCDFFTTNIFKVKGINQRRYKNADSFKIFMCVEGNGTIEVDGSVEAIGMGETVLTPASAKSIRFIGEDAKFLEVYIRTDECSTIKWVS